MTIQLNGVGVCVASSGRPVHLRWATSLPSLAYPVGMSVGWFCTEGPDRAKNREKLVDEVLKTGAPFSFLLDDDTVCPNFTIRWLHAEMEKDPKIAICGGIYCTKEDPPEPIVFKKMGGGPFYQWKVGSVFECAGLGTGCMLVRNEVFKHISKPWFLEPDEVFVDAKNGKPSRVVGTDDLFFCDKVGKAGYKIMAHGGVLPVHIDQDGKMYTLPIDSYPCRGMGLKKLRQK
jgi:hypothetical protein